MRAKGPKAYACIQGIEIRIGIETLQLYKYFTFFGGLLIEHHANDHIKRETHCVIGAREFSTSSIIGQSRP